MSLTSRIAPRLRNLRPTASVPFRTFASTSSLRSEEWPQRTPMGAYYESIINKPSPYPFEEKPEEPPKSADPEVLPEEKKSEDTTTETTTKPPKKKPGRKPKASASAASAAAASAIKTSKVSKPAAAAAASPPTPAPPPATAEEKARIIFGTRLAGPDDKASHLASKKSQSTYIAGVLVPPPPEEPDNCCMSGCVNCVWDMYREDMEEFTAKRNEANRKLKAASASMDDDGGGTETAWSVQQSEETNKLATDLWDEKLFRDIPVGIREFMKSEKRLKERHERQGTVGG